jgi:succinate dehydrogenase / fumarate reductase, flavoprotein subunit
MHGANRLGGNSLSDLLVFGRRAGAASAEYALGRPPVAISEARVAEVTTKALSCFDNDGGENPYALHSELQESMQSLVGIIRTESELVEARQLLDEYDSRAEKMSIEGHRQFNPGWHLALDLESMLAVARSTTLAAIERRESRGAHTRDDYPNPDPEHYGKVNMVVSLRDGAVGVHEEPLPVMPDELRELVEEAH